MPNFSIPLSGLSACDTALATISNNLANLNTTAYKDATASFQDLFYQLMGTNGAGDMMQVGGGATVNAISSNFKSGSVQDTGVSTDVSITGNGFYVVQDGSNLYYTRAGNFTQDKDGYLVTADGYKVMGYPAVGGVVNTTGGLQAIQLPMGMTNPPVQTTTMSINANLSSATATGGTYDTSITVYDSLGTSHVLSIDFTENSTGNWGYTVTVPSSEVTGGTGTNTTVATGTLSFDSSGQLTSTTPISLSIPNLADGAANMSISWALANSSGTGLVTQVAGASGTSATSQNGYTSGSLNSFTINADGTIDGTFTNGSQVVGQMALANFANLQGLSKEGNNTYAATINSGAAVVGAPGTSSLGTLVGGALELSNVDMSTEFSNLIVAERGYQANAKSVTTFDQIAQDTINLIR
ncbi:MAG: flagellar hook protein FlgE [Acidobacteriota bacterium]|nr:flagellar hook protein FlgE [Acidobacteriota bacterium]